MGEGGFFDSNVKKYVVNASGQTSHFRYATPEKPGIKPPFPLSPASVVRCSAAQQRTDDRICRSIASTGLAALVKLRNGWTPVKALPDGGQSFLQMPIVTRECDANAASGFTHLSPCRPLPEFQDQGDAAPRKGFCTRASINNKP